MEQNEKETCYQSMEQNEKETCYQSMEQNEKETCYQSMEQNEKDVMLCTSLISSLMSTLNLPSCKNNYVCIPYTFFHTYSIMDY